jgi:transposase
VFNDGLRVREQAHQATLPYLRDAELSRRLTLAKSTPERMWLNEVSSVVLQQALTDLNTAYRNYLTSIKGKRAGPKVGAPKFRSRKDQRQTIRFTRSACGVWLDRDINAAVNVAKAAGLAVTACGAQVRPGIALALRGEAGTHPKSRR